MSDGTGGLRPGVLPVVRLLTALALSWLGGLFAVGSYIAMRWQISPWSGQRSSTLGAIGYGALMVLVLTGPMVAWWFLLPRARWWGVPTTVFMALATFAAFGFSF